MKQLKYMVKYSPLIYSLYYYVVSAFLRLAGLFIKTDPNMILFNSFGGRKFDDSPRAIFEEMLRDERFRHYSFVWALDRPCDFDLPERARVVKDYSISFFLCALRARVWITNSSMEHGLCFKKRNTIYFNTWHGSAIKYLGDDVRKEGKSFKEKGSSKEDAFFTQGEYDEYVFERAFHMDKTLFKRFGLPRNDELVNYSETRVSQIKKDLGIDQEKKILLYAPTFREYCRDNGNQIIQDVKIDLTRWEKEMGDACVLLIRAHYEVAKTLNISANQSVLDVSSYPHLNDLLIISDALISDYSSIFFDYSILHRPMLCYAYDYDEYLKNRGTYFDIKEKLPCDVIENEDGLFTEIERMFQNYEKMCEKTARFQGEFITEYGAASKKTCDYLAEILE